MITADWPAMMRAVERPSPFAWKNFGNLAACLSAYLTAK